MANKIILKKSSVASKVPLATDLEIGEVAVNLADQKLYSKNASGTVIVVGNGVGGTGTVTSVSGTGTASGLSLSGTVTTSGNLTLSGTVNSLASGTYAVDISGNAATATTFVGDQTNWASYRSNAVANMLGWKNYSNGHVIFDASAGTSPTGASVNNTNPDVSWSATYPTLMGWNGVNTFGVRVDSAKNADNADTVDGYHVSTSATANTIPTRNASGYLAPGGWIQFDSTYGLYWANNYGCHLYPNTVSTYTQFTIQGNKNGYGGIYDYYSGVNIGMFDSAGNGGVYREAYGWYTYHNASNHCTGFNTSSTTSGYDIYLPNGAYSPTQMSSPIYYDANDTSYYCDPAGASQLSTFTAATNARSDLTTRKFNRQAYTTDSDYWTGTRGWGTACIWDDSWKYGFGGMDIWGSNTGHPQGSGYIHAQGINAGMHYTNSDASAAYGWQIVGAANAGNRWWGRGKWGSTTYSWVEFVTSGTNNNYTLYADIYYDANNTGYYVNPASTSVLNYVVSYGAYARGNAGTGYLDGQYAAAETSSTSGAIYTIGGGYAPNASNLGNMYGIGYAYAPGTSGLTSLPGSWGLYVASGGTPLVWLEANSGIVYAASNIRAPIYYDSNNTGYYIDPASTSNLNALAVASLTVAGGSVATQSAGGVVLENGQTISSDYTMTSGKNGSSAGPITIATGVTVTIPTGSNWVIV